MSIVNRRKVILFGVGKVFSMFMRMYDQDKVDILLVCDNNADIQGTEVCGIKVCAPSEIVETDCEYIIVTSSYFEDIKKQVLQLGIDEKKVLNFYEVYNKLSLDNDLVVEMLRDDIFFDIVSQKPYEYQLQKIKDIQEKNLFLSAKNYIESIRGREHIGSLEEVEFQVFSQFGEDGIIQWLIQNVELNDRTFIEFGVEDYLEANTRFLLMNNNWTGLVIDGSEKNMKSLKEWRLFWKYDLTAVAKFITRDNINEIIMDAGFYGDIGILSVDIDGNDYWVLNAITCVKPRILICEYNNIFGPDEKVSVPYDEEFIRTKKHYSNLYWGASISAFCDWAEQNNYFYMGSNSAGNNAFFVRKDCISEDKIPAKSKQFIQSKYRESRGEDGHLTYLRGAERLKEIKEMELVNLVNNNRERIADIYHLE